METDVLQTRPKADAPESNRGRLARRFETLSALTDGWLDGRGLAPEKDKLTEVAARMAGSYPEQLPPPLVTPTPEGNLLFEWDVPGDPSVDLYLGSMHADFHAFRPDGSDIEREFVLAGDEDWGRFIDFLKHALEQRAV